MRVQTCLFFWQDVDLDFLCRSYVQLDGTFCHPTFVEDIFILFETKINCLKKSLAKSPLFVLWLLAVLRETSTTWSLVLRSHVWYFNIEPENVHSFALDDFYLGCIQYITGMMVRSILTTNQVSTPGSLHAELVTLHFLDQNSITFKEQINGHYMALYSNITHDSATPATMSC